MPNEISRNIAVIMRNNLDQSAPGLGGAEISLGQMLKFNAQWRVYSPFDIPDNQRPMNVSISKTDVVTIKDSWHSFPTAHEIERVRKELIEMNPDAILLNHPGTFAGIIFLFLPIALQKRSAAIWRMTLNGQVPTRKQGDSKDAIISRQCSAMQRRLGNLVGANLPISNAVADSLVEFGISKNIKPILNQVGNDFGPQLRLSQGEKIRSKFLKPDELGILVVSRIAPGKGIDWVPKIYKRLFEIKEKFSINSDFKRIKITLAGDTAPHQINLFHQLQAELQEISSHYNDQFNTPVITCELAGKKLKPDLEELYNAYDVLLNPSPDEGFGRVTIEGMQTGNAVIGNASCKATLAILNEPPYKVGWLAETPEYAAEHIAQLMLSRQALSQVQKHALEWSKRYTMENAEISLFNAIDSLSC